jgi:hypothetical protein
VKPVLFFLFNILIFSASVSAQSTDSVLTTPDSLRIVPVVDSIKPVSLRSAYILQNKILNSDAKPVSLALKVKKQNRDDAFFIF